MDALTMTERQSIKHWYRYEEVEKSACPQILLQAHWMDVSRSEEELDVVDQRH
jgi:hypothetical protein